MVEGGFYQFDMIFKLTILIALVATHLFTKHKKNSTMNNTINFAEAMQQGSENWPSGKSVKTMHQPVKDMLKRFQKAYQAAHGGKQPTMSEAVTYMACRYSEPFTNHIERLEKHGKNNQKKAGKVAVPKV